MELSGEEKKLQALYSELKTADEQTTPHFARVWNRAQVAPRRIGLFNPAFVAVAVLLVFGTVAFAVWTRYSRTVSPSPPEIVKAPPANNPTKPTEQPPATTLPPEVKPPKTSVAARGNRPSTRHTTLVAAADRKLAKDAKSISNWTSPTSALLESPSDEIFNSLPELNQSATQLKSFLPSRSN